MNDSGHSDSSLRTSLKAVRATGEGAVSRPILFSAPMVRALLAGTKTQTRRIVKGERASRGMESGWLLKPYGFLNNRQFAKAACPYGQPGDQLWVRETWGYFDPDGGDQAFEDDGGPRTFRDELLQEGHPLRDYWRRRVAHAATWKEPRYGNGPAKPARWRPSIHMPRWASRITLEITGVRVERLQDISEADAVAEGVNEWSLGALSYDGHCHYAPDEKFRMLWESINGADSWDANPWVWVVEFRRMEQPVNAKPVPLETLSGATKQDDQSGVHHG